jgi:hypothetical protein
VTTATTSVTTRMTLRVSTYPSKRLYGTMGYGVQGRVRNETAARGTPWLNERLSSGIPCEWEHAATQVRPRRERL